MKKGSRRAPAKRTKGRATVRRVAPADGAALEWGRAQGCVAFGSDAVADNETSALAHRALGFEEVDVIRVFRKDL